jgi:hypothetical protein
MTVRITVGGPNPEVAFQIRAQVQEHLLDYLNRFKKGSLIGAVAEPKPAVDSPAIPPPNVVAATTAS